MSDNKPLDIPDLLRKPKNLAAERKVMPGKRAVIRCLQGEIDVYRNSYKEADGIIRNSTALHIIRCLEVALLCVQEKKFRTGSKS